MKVCQVTPPTRRQVPDNVVVFAVGKVVIVLDTPVLMSGTNRFAGNDTLFWVPNELTLNNDPDTVVPFARVDCLPFVVAVAVAP